MTWSQTCFWQWLKSRFFQRAFPGPGAGAMSAVFFGPFERNLGSVRVRPPAQWFSGVRVAVRLCFVSWLFVEFSAQPRRVNFPQCSPLREVRQAFLPMLQIKKLNRKMTGPLTSWGQESRWPDSQLGAFSVTQLYLPMFWSCCASVHSYSQNVLWGQSLNSSQWLQGPPSSLSTSPASLKPRLVHL